MNCRVIRAFYQKFWEFEFRSLSLQLNSDHMNKLYLAIAMLLFIACGQNSDKAISISTEDYISYLKPLASDEFMGRKPFTEGETLTTNFLKDAFIDMGLDPGNEHSYFQDVPLVEIDCIPDTLMQLKGNKETLTLEIKEEFVAYTEQVVDKVSIEDAELVFLWVWNCSSRI